MTKNRQGWNKNFIFISTQDFGEQSQKAVMLDKSIIATFIAEQYEKESFVNAVRDKNKFSATITVYKL